MRKSVQLSREQWEIIESSDLATVDLERAELEAVASGKLHVSMIDTDRLLTFLKVTNALYRAGLPLIDDQDYDFVFLAELKRREPNHPWLQVVEPEVVVTAKTVELPSRMLSTDKAYDFDSIRRWGTRVEKAAVECGLRFEELRFRATPKLDGFAAFDDGTALYTRGDGRRGTDITRAFERGLQVAQGGSRGLGAGEIVVSRSYFEEHLSEDFENTRNIQASLIREKELDELTSEIIRKGKAVFFPFALLPDWQGSWQELERDFDAITSRLWDMLDYDTDGIVFEVEGERLRAHMGATRHHHRWQIAYKQNSEFAMVRVLDVVPQTSRSGRVNPVAEVEPTRLSGARIRRATAHHYQMVREQGIGPGALIKLSRSGEVIPKIEEVQEPADPRVPESCPSCGGRLIWENDYLFCINTMNCPAQITTSIEHFFRMLGNVDGFGPASITKLYENKVRGLPELYQMSSEEFEELGFGPKQSENMVAQLMRSRTEAIEDWRFLAAFGIFRMGLGNCERLLENVPLEKIFTLNQEDIIAIKGFSEKSAAGIIAGLEAIRPLFDELFGLGFNLISTSLAEQEEAADELTSPIAGKTIVFTGAMQSGSRDIMKKEAKALGARIGSSVSSKTDFLVCGDRVGAAKMKKAEGLGVKLLLEEEYLKLIAR